MYIMEDFVDMGLNKGQEWKSEAHRKVAIAVLIGNSNITQLDQLQDGVQKILDIPK